jgi:hypothetical protein
MAVAGHKKIEATAAPGLFPIEMADAQVDARMPKRSE